MSRVTQRLAALFRKGSLDRELENEIAGHLELAERDARARGLSEEDARREARQAFGGLDGVREAHRDARSVRALETLWRDVRYALRGLIRTPMVCATVVLVLGVAIGANTAMFTALRGIILRPLAYADADQLVIVMHDGRIVAELPAGASEELVLSAATGAAHPGAAALVDDALEGEQA